ncbi:MAG TPA: murein biosynthesis integral membrane protein MurJ [Armatimonadota bacterium]|jgi:putative peptidoglycan lipid II flippase
MALSQSQRGSTLTAASIIFFGTLTSRVLGFVREYLLNNSFKDKMVTDAFRSAILVPDILYYLLAGGALSAAFIPVFSDYLTRGQREDANRISNSVMTLMLLAICGGLVLLLLFAPWVVRLVAWGYPPGSAQFNLTVILARELCVMVLFTGVSALMTGMLQSVNHFLAPVVIWNTYTLGIIVGIGVFSKLPVPSWMPGFFHWTGPTLGIHGMALGVILGAVSLVAIQAPVVKRYGFSYAPVIDLAHEGVRKVLNLFTPVMAGLALSQINLLAVPQIIASLQSKGTVTDVGNATRLVLLPLGLFGTAVSSAAFPRLSQQATLGAKQAFTRLMNRSVRAILLLVMPSAAVMLVLAQPIIAFLLAGDEFGLTDIRATAFLLAFFSWGILAASLVQLISRGFYALHDTRTPVVVQIGMVVASLGISLALMYGSPFGYGGVAIAFSLTMTASTVVLLELLRRRLGRLGGRSIFTSLWKIALATVAMGVVLYGVSALIAPVATNGTQTLSLGPVFPCPWPLPDLAHALPGGAHPLPGHHHLRLQIAGQLTIALLAGVLAYLGVLWVLKEEMLLAFFRRLRKR